MVWWGIGRRRLFTLTGGRGSSEEVMKQKTIMKNMRDTHKRTEEKRFGYHGESSKNPEMDV